MFASSARVMIVLSLAVLYLPLLVVTNALNIADATVSRRRWLHEGTAASTALATLLAIGQTAAPPAVAAASDMGTPPRLDDATLRRTVRADLLDRQFLATGALTRSIYEPTATFTDEIDTYALDQWITGTQRLFVGDQSSVRLVGDVQVQADKVEFRFDEDLMFNIPLVRPVVSLTGRVELLRNVETGRIASYREYWDQDVLTVVKSAKLFGK